MPSFVDVFGVVYGAKCLGEGSKGWICGPYGEFIIYRLSRPWDTKDPVYPRGTIFAEYSLQVRHSDDELEYLRLHPIRSFLSSQPERLIKDICWKLVRGQSLGKLTPGAPPVCGKTPYYLLKDPNATYKKVFPFPKNFIGGYN